MNLVVATVSLDIYDHDTTPATLKTIALDKETRYVQAYLQERGEVYQPGQNDTVELIALRPDGVGVISDGEVVLLEEAFEINPDIYGVRAEIVQAMLVVAGMVKLQFRITSGDQVLRTEIFVANNGKALDAETSNWADPGGNYDVDEFVRGHRVTRISAVTAQEFMEVSERDPTTLYVVRG